MFHRDVAPRGLKSHRQPCPKSTPFDGLLVAAKEHGFEYLADLQFPVGRRERDFMDVLLRAYGDRDNRAVNGQLNRGCSGITGVDCDCRATRFIVGSLLLADLRASFASGLLEGLFDDREEPWMAIHAELANPGHSAGY